MEQNSIEPTELSSTLISLKAAAYDLIAELEVYQERIKLLHEQLIKMNEKIQSVDEQIKAPTPAE